jgi:hypothetical protein
VKRKFHGRKPIDIAQNLKKKSKTTNILRLFKDIIINNEIVTKIVMQCIVASGEC